MQFGTKINRDNASIFQNVKEKIKVSNFEKFIFREIAIIDEIYFMTQGFSSISLFPFENSDL